MDYFPAILLHGTAGLGLWDVLGSAATSLLCEQPRPATTPNPATQADPALQACGSCPACRLMQAGTHPDLKRLVPEALALELGLGQGAEVQATSDGDKVGDKRNPSKDISIDAVRGLVDWAHTTSHRGGLKIAVVYPLDAMAAPAANALLKTLEEPPLSLRFLTGTHRLDRVLPTIHSRCRLVSMPKPPEAQALRLLQDRGIAQSAQVARWCRHAVHDPDPARGMDWACGLLRQLSTQHDNATVAARGPAPPMPVAVAAMQKLCMDTMRAALKLQAAYLPSEQALVDRLSSKARVPDLLAFWLRLLDYSSTATFPLHAGLTSEAMVLEFEQLFTRSAH